MLKDEKGDTYVNWVIVILVILFFAAITIRILVGENGLLNQIKQDKIRNETENNITIELTNAAEDNFDE